MAWKALVCIGLHRSASFLQAGNNDYKNPFGPRTALLRTSEGGMARMAVAWDMPGAQGEQGRVYGEKVAPGNGNPRNTDRPPLPPTMPTGRLGNSHGHLTTEFIDAILRDRKAWINIIASLNMTVAEYDGRRHRGSPVGAPRRRVPEDSAIHPEIQRTGAIRRKKAAMNGFPSAIFAVIAGEEKPFQRQVRDRCSVKMTGLY